MSVKRFRPRVTVEAIQYNGTNDMAIAEWTGRDTTRSTGPDADLYIDLGAAGRLLTVGIGEWIIRGTTGGFFTCRPEAFAKNYEPELNPIEVAQKRLGEAHAAVVDAAQELAEAMAAAVGVPQR